MELKLRRGEGDSGTAAGGGRRKEEGGRRKEEGDEPGNSTAREERRGEDCGVLRVGQRRRAREECERGTRKAQG